MVKNRKKYSMKKKVNRYSSDNDSEARKFKASTGNGALITKKLERNFHVLIASDYISEKSR